MLRMYLSAYLRVEVLNSVGSARLFGLQYFVSDISLDDNIVMLPDSNWVWSGMISPAEPDYLGITMHMLDTY